ncbi:hypothetical protein Bpla01_63990 [Burkholderia plantarii]|nr:hypothetical protein Bpla01_63990 [Burkholderia plantarii]
MGHHPGQLILPWSAACAVAPAPKRVLERIERGLLQPMGRLDDDDRLRRQACEHGRQQPQFTDAGLLCQQLNEATSSCASAVCVAVWTHRRDASLAASRSIVPSPQ